MRYGRSCRGERVGNDINTVLKYEILKKEMLKKKGKQKARQLTQQVQGQPRIYNEFQDSLSYSVKTGLKKFLID